MGTLYIDRKDAALDYDAGQLRVREPGEKPKGYPIRVLERVVISGNVTLSTQLLTHLAEAGVGVLMMEGRGARRYAHLSSMEHGDASRRIGQYRVCSDASTSLPWAQRVVRGRASGIRRLLSQALRQRPDLRYQLLPAVRSLSDRRPSLITATTIDSLRGMEGATGALFFRAYTALFADSLAFTNRNRRPPRDPVNAALSLGYSLTHTDAVRACLSSGLDPMLGVYHQPEHNRESLACDLNELARHHVEALVWRLFAERQLTANHFETHNGACFLKKDARHIYFVAFEQAAAPIRRTLRLASARFARHCAAVEARS